MQLFYSNVIEGNFIELSQEESHHAIKVLRKQCGDELNVIDGMGNLYLASIIDPHAKRCKLQVISIESGYDKLPYKLTMAVAPTKNIDRTEWFIEKATEVGVDSFTMLQCQHSERKNVNPERLEKVIMSAVKQSLKAYKPSLTDMTSFKSFVSQDFGNAELYIAHCDSSFESIHLKKMLKTGDDVVILIGPEGDFSHEEITMALNKGFKSISLGKQRLRTETAALYAVTTVALNKE